MRRTGFAFALPLACAAAFGCSADPTCADAACSGAAQDAGDTGHEVRATTRDAACEMQSERASRVALAPLDVIFVIDNSGSMMEEIAAIRSNINQNFAALIAASGADYRVIVISLFGTQNAAVCIEPPLAGAECSAGLHANSSPVFFHYNAEIGSSDALCQILATIDRPDAEQRAPHGWQAFLRPEAHKAFVVVTDDSAACRYEDDEVSVQFGTGADADPFADALQFHQALLAKAPEQFGVPPDVRYQFFAFAGMRASVPATQPWFPHDALQPERCDSAASPGLSYQALSVITDALRYPVCDGRGFDSVFRVLAQTVVDSTKASCVFEIPEAPPGESISRASIGIEYRPGGREPAQAIAQVEDPAACNDHAFVLREDRIELCPEACARVEADPGAQLDVFYACFAVPE